MWYTNLRKSIYAGNLEEKEAMLVKKCRRARARKPDNQLSLALTSKKKKTHHDLNDAACNQKLSWVFQFSICIFYKIYTKRILGRWHHFKFLLTEMVKAIMS